ncbi:MAG: tetratricopeptide repeat protein [Actinobacteria bacterium]|nr:tetratricopeptide repeat protein [Actinomycetota bacterium]
MVDTALLQGTVAIVVVDVDGPTPYADTRATTDALAERAQAHRGALLRSQGKEHVLAFTSAPRALSFAMGLQDDLGWGRPVRLAIHIGELTHRDGEVYGSAVNVCRRLTEAAEPGAVLASAVVHDVLGASTEHRFVPVPLDHAGPAGAAMAYRVDAARSVPPMAGRLAGPPARLVDRLQEATRRARLSLVLGRAGSGKTTLVRALADLHPTVWLSIPRDGLRPATLAREIVSGLRIRVPGLPATLNELGAGLQSEDQRSSRSRAETLAASVGEALTDALSRDLYFVVDGADHLATSRTCVALLEAIARNAPPELRLVLIARRDPGLRTDRLRTSGGVATIDDATLRLEDAEVIDLARRQLGRSGTDAAVEAVVRFADGNPEAATLAAARLRLGGGPPLDSVTAVARELVESRDDTDRTLLETLDALESATPQLLAAVTGFPVLSIVPGLAADGLIRSLGVRSDVLEVGAATADVLLVDDELRSRANLAAARELRRVDDPAAALRHLRRTPDRMEPLSLLLEHGRRLLQDGAWPSVLETVGEAARDPAILFTSEASTTEGLSLGPEAAADLAALIGEAWRMAGDRGRALTWFEHASRALDPVPPWLAWRTGMLLHFGGELDQARELYARTGDEGSPGDRAMVHAWAGAAAWMQSDIDSARREAEHAIEITRSHHHDHALAATYTLRAMLAAVDGDRAANDHYYLRALEHAERAGDLLQLVRVRTNRGSRLLEEGEHVEALAELEVSLRHADLIGAVPLQAMALSNRGQVLRRLGRLDEATADLVTSRESFERTGSRWVGYALGHLGELYQVRGERALAMSSFEEALAQCAPVGDTQGTVPALAGLARLVLPHDPRRARELADRASMHPDSLGHVDALAALTEVALAQGETSSATQANVEGLRVARSRRDRPGLATHLVLRARLTTDPQECRALLEEARTLWSRMGCVLEEARTDVALAALEPAAASIATIEAAVRTLRTRGARTWADQGEATLTTLRAETAAPLHMRVLGGFELQHSSRPVTSVTTDSDARQLFAYLVVMQDRSGPRERIAATLWPDADDAQSRLIDALGDLQGALEPLDEDAAAAIGDLRIDPARISSDLEVFRDEAERGLSAVRDGRPVVAEAHLVTAEATYGGELLEGWPMLSWLAIARDDASELYLQVVMALVDLEEGRGDSHGAVRLLLRVVERDPFDEAAHLRLVACLERAGRRGESRRRYRAYTARMQEIGVEPAPFPDVSPAPEAS